MAAKLELKVSRRRSNPDGKPVWLESVIAVPTDDPENFDEGFLRPEKVDMSNDFLKDCGNNHFYLPPTVEGDFMIGKVAKCETIIKADFLTWYPNADQQVKMYASSSVGQRSDACL